MKELAVYIHIPFCVKKCLYCDFLSKTPCNNEIDRYLDALLKEIRLNAKYASDYTVKSIFIGGGTPSLLDADYIVNILNDLKQAFEIVRKGSYSPKEITIECNPGTVDYNKFLAYRSCGINRISLGLQSANDNELSMLGRIHTCKQWEQAVDAAKRAGFSNINTDLISGLPNQTRESFLYSLNKVIEKDIPHISVYSLIIEEGTPFYDKYNPNRLTEAEYDEWEKEDRFIYDMTHEELMKHGYKRYEISNYSKPGYECIHNLVYWNRGDYIGIGLGAASLINNVRFSNQTDLNEYIKGNNSYDGYQELSADECLSEHIMLGLRKTEGISINETDEKYGINLLQEYGNVIDKWTNLGMLIIKGDRLHCTEQGLSISNSIIVDFL